MTNRESNRRIWRNGEEGGGREGGGREGGGREGGGREGGGREGGGREGGGREGGRRESRQRRREKKMSAYLLQILQWCALGGLGLSPLIQTRGTELCDVVVPQY